MSEKVDMILKGLESGKSREEIAKELGYKNYKSLDIFMRRNNYTYNSKIKNYVSSDKKIKENKQIYEQTNTPTKVLSIIKLFEKEDADPKAIAKLMRFSSYNEMAAYMKSKGYIWSNEKSNYIFEPSSVSNEAAATIELTNDTENDYKGFEKYIPLLDILEKNKEVLLENLYLNRVETTVPRYLIPGVFITKSVHISNSLDRLVKEYSKEKNISQREIFEIALVNFFRQYGYKKEIDALLRS